MKSKRYLTIEHQIVDGSRIVDVIRAVRERMSSPIGGFPMSYAIRH